MARLLPTADHTAARNAASIDFADAGAGVSSIRLYTAQGGTLLAVRKLKKPCGALNPAGRIALAQADADDLVLETGSATWGEWCNGDGDAIGSGHVTDDQGDYTDGGSVVPHPSGVGPFVLTGTVGTSIFAGGIVRLTTALIG